MVRNEKEYKVTRVYLREREAALAERQTMTVPDDVDKGMWQLEQDALQSQIEELRGELEGFDRLKAG